MIATFKLGMLLGLSIIISIGAQNLYIIQQAIRNEYTYLSALTCFICDVILITLGATGVSVVFIKFPMLKTAILLLGIIFLVWYGVKAIRRGIAGETVNEQFDAMKNAVKSNSLTKIVLLGLSFSLLNPAAILDTIVIIGGSANHYLVQEKYLFVAGTISASFVWFFGLAALTKHLSRKITSNLFWRTLDFVSGGLMLGIALNFVTQL